MPDPGARERERERLASCVGTSGALRPTTRRLNGHHAALAGLCPPKPQLPGFSYFSLRSLLRAPSSLHDPLHWFCWHQGRRDLTSQEDLQNGNMPGEGAHILMNSFCLPAPNPKILLSKGLAFGPSRYWQKVHYWVVSGQSSPRGPKGQSKSTSARASGATPSREGQIPPQTQSREPPEWVSLSPTYLAGVRLWEKTEGGSPLDATGSPWRKGRVQTWQTSSF